MSDKPASKKSDLSVRLISAFVMISVAGAALWLGGLWFDAFIVGVASVTFVEFFQLIRKVTQNSGSRVLATILGAAYVAAAAYILTIINATALILLIVGVVVCVDTFAYFFGRSIGGPKIAPSISPSKTWAGLLGGTVGATFAILCYFWIPSFDRGLPFAVSLSDFLAIAASGCLLALLAQAGDFFESWLKRRAGVKDSSNLIPGHGGFFDRVDGLLPVAIFLGGLLMIYRPHWLNP